MTKTQPYSVRLSPTADALVAEEVSRSGRSRSAIVQELTEEAAKARLFPGIAFRGPDPRRPWVIGTGLDVWEIIEMHRDYDGELDRLLDAHESLSERSVLLALAYAERFPEEIERAIAENRRPVEEWRALYPFLGLSR